MKTKDTYRTLWQYPDVNPPPNGDVECRWGKQKSRFSTSIWSHRVLSTPRPSGVINTVLPDRGKL